MALSASRGQILIVEDNRDLRQLYKRAFRRAGYEIAEAGNGFEALHHLQHTDAAPSLIVLDLMMPKMDGWEFLREYRALHPDPEIPIVVVSASSEQVPMGVRVLSKPIDLDQLVRLANDHAISVNSAM